MSFQFPFLPSYVRPKFKEVLMRSVAKSEEHDSLRQDEMGDVHILLVQRDGV